LITRPAESNWITDGAVTQQTREVGGVKLIERSGALIEFGPRCTTQTLSLPSIATPLIAPSTQ
jgi:hypothetical protein